MDPYKERLRKVFSHTDADAIVLPKGAQQSSNFLYMTGLEGDLFEGSIAVLTPDGITLLVNVLEDAAAMRGVSPSIRVRRYGSVKEAESMIREHTRGRTVGFDGASLPFAQHRRIRRVAQPRSMADVSSAFSEARAVKGSDEVANIRGAIRTVKRAFSAIQDSFRPGVTELEVVRRFDSIVRELGSEPSFATIVCFGKNSAIPHHVSDGTRLRPNSLVLIDAGAKRYGYCSDITRTFIFRPERSSRAYSRMSDIYATVREAQSAALAAASPGSFGYAAHRAAERVINSHDGGIYKGRFIHGLGHSLGIDVHDSERWALAPRCHGRIREGMVFSDEPGIYLQGFGGVRIEDDILVTGKGAVML